MIFNPSSEKPSRNSFLNPDIFKTFQKNFIFYEHLGTGLSGVTFEVIGNDGSSVAVKLMLANRDAFNECYIGGGSVLGTLQHDTEVFTYTKGWIIFNEIPDRWKQHLKGCLDRAVHLKKQFNNSSTRFLYQIMEVNSCSLLDIEDITKDELIQVLFMLLHGIYVATKKFPYFRHRDIHCENIMIQQLDYAKDVTLITTDKKFFMPGVRYIPKIIDFGETRITKEGHPNDNTLEDISSFKDHDGRLFKARNDINRIRGVLSWKLQKNDDLKILKFFTSDFFEQASKTPFTENWRVKNLIEDEFFQCYGISVNEVTKKQKKSD
jgi:serine/threonine protein kinase